jgi:hypothetical protein
MAAVEQREPSAFPPSIRPSSMPRWLQVHSRGQVRSCTRASTLAEQHAAAERWLREEVASAYDAMQADPSRAIPAQSVFDDIRAYHAVRLGGGRRLGQQTREGYLSRASGQSATGMPKTHRRVTKEHSR